MRSDSALSAATVTEIRPAIQATADNVLIRLIASGDREAMRMLFARHSARVFHFIVRLIGQNSVAEDLASEVFIDVWRNAGQFEARCQVSTWLLAIARYKALSWLRSRATDQLDDAIAGAIEDPADNPEVSCSKIDTRALLRKCLTQLSPAHREVIDLIYYHERSMDEVAAILQIPAPTVRTRMFYARKRLAELLKAHGVEHAWQCW
jgi:RNA polymerase sigma-70 factor (ECF subfamily)